MVNLPDTERMAKSHQGQLPTLRRAEEAAAVVFQRWGRLQ
jgi:hypothetical protein